MGPLGTGTALWMGKMGSLGTNKGVDSGRTSGAGYLFISKNI